MGFGHYSRWNDGEREGGGVGCISDEMFRLIEMKTMMVDSHQVFVVAVVVVVSLIVPGKDCSDSH